MYGEMFENPLDRTVQEVFDSLRKDVEESGESFAEDLYLLGRYNLTIKVARSESAEEASSD